MGEDVAGGVLWYVVRNAPTFLAMFFLMLLAVRGRLRFSLGATVGMALGIACAYDARVIEVPMLESQFHAGPFSRRLLGHCTICAQRNGDYPRSCVCFLHNGRSSETRGAACPKRSGTW